MLTPLDLQKIEFAQKMGGYKKNDVDEVFSALTQSYEALYKENNDLKSKIETLEEALNTYKTMDETMKSTLLAAQKTADEIIASAQEKANLILKESELSAERAKKDNEEAIRASIEKKEKIKVEMIAYSTQISAILDAQKSLLNKILGDNTDTQ